MKYTWLWYESGYREPNEIARCFYENGIFIQVYETHIKCKSIELHVLQEVINAHIVSGWNSERYIEV